MKNLNYYLYLERLPTNLTYNEILYSYFSYLSKTGRILSSKSQYNDKTTKWG